MDCALYHFAVSFAVLAVVLIGLGVVAWILDQVADPAFGRRENRPGGEWISAQLETERQINKELVKQLEHINRHRDPRECEEIEADRDLLEKENARLREALRSNIFSVHLIAFESGYRSRERNENLQEGLAKARAALAKAKP